MGVVGAGKVRGCVAGLPVDVTRSVLGEDWVAVDGFCVTGAGVAEEAVSSLWSLTGSFGVAVVCAGLPGAGLEGLGVELGLASSLEAALAVVEAAVGCAERLPSE